MRKLSLTFPNEITEEMCLFLLNRPKICKKQSRMGWSSNDRILNVRDNYLEYYNIHPGFSEDNPQSLKVKYFKAAVPLDFIHEVNYLPKNTVQKTHLEIIFPQKKKINNAKDQSKSGDLEEQQNKGGKQQQVLQKWVFQFTFDLIEHIQQKREEAKQQKRLLAKIAQILPQQLLSPIQFKKGYKLSEENILTPKSKTNSVGYDDVDHQENIEKYVQTIQKTKNILKSKAEMAEEQKNRQLKKKEKQLAQIKSIKAQDVEQKFSISSFWRQYFRFYELIMKVDNKANRTQKMDRQIDLLRQIESFNSMAKKVVQNYIDLFVSGFDQTTRRFEGFGNFQGLWLKLGGKQLNQEFMINYCINDVLFSLKDIRGFKIRVPLMSLFQYKGFKILVMCDMPFSELERTEVYNLAHQEGDLLLAGKLKECLDVIEDILNLKSQPFEIQSKKKIMAPLGANLKIYQYHFKKDKTQDQITLPNFYYLINIGMIFPVNYHFQKDQPSYLARLRPQIIAFFRDCSKDQNTQLLSQAFMDSTLPQEIKREQDKKAIQASKLIDSYWIPQLVQKLNDCELLFTDSYSIKSIMHQMGINVRYLYRIYDKVNLPYVRQLIVVQVLARTIKKQFRQALSELSYETSLRQKRGSGQSSKDRTEYIGNKRFQYIGKYKAFAIDYLNLVFGEGEQTFQFWKIILKKCQKYFKISSVYPPPVKAGCLLNAVLWHCGLSLNFNDKVPLFKSKTPFFEQQQVQFQMKMKTFDFPSFQIQKLYRSAPSFTDNINFQLFKQSNPRLLKMELLFGKTIGNNWTLNTTMAKLNNYEQYLQKPNVKNTLHPIHIPYYISNKSAYNFKCGMNILNFSLPQTHPLFVSFYIEYSSILDPQLMKKAALLLAVKCFGEYHPKTTEIYSKYYQEGYEEYKEKAQRMKDVAACQVISRQYFNDSKYQSCLNYCIEQVNKMKEKKGGQRLGTGNYQIYLYMLLQGLQSAVKTLAYQKGIFLSKSISEVVSSFKYKDRTFTQALYRQTLKIHLLKSTKKYFLYKMVLFVIHIRASHEQVSYDKQKLVLPCNQQEKNKIVDGLTSEYYQHGDHSNWIAYILATIIKSFQYFNFLEDLFNNYTSHLNRYNSDQFKSCIGYFDLLVRLFGQEFFKQTLYDVRFN